MAECNKLSKHALFQASVKLSSILLQKIVETVDNPTEMVKFSNIKFIIIPLQVLIM